MTDVSKQGKLTVQGNWITPKARATWVFLLKPGKAQKREDGTMADPKYSLVLLFDKDADFSIPKKMATDALNEKFGERMKNAEFVKSLRNPFRDQGSRIDKDGKLPPGYTAGHIFITASGKQKPGVVDAAGADIIEEKDIYSGCYVRASLRAYAYEEKGNRGAAFGLQNVQKLEDGEPLGGRSRPQDDFEAVAGAGAPAGAEPKSIFG